MTGESSSTRSSTQPLGRSSSTRPAPAIDHANVSEYRNPAERYPTFADYVAATESVPQAAATTLDVARARAFTGELTFAIRPEVRMYLDCGFVYYAERVGDVSLSSRLLDAGVIDGAQLHRGVVRIGDVDHLGRFFDRDTSVDRHAVMAAVEAATDDLVEEVANSVIASATVSAYRHHPSGLHRWFVAPIEPTGLPRPSSGVMQVDRSVVDDLPRLSALSTTADPTSASRTALAHVDRREFDPTTRETDERVGDGAPGWTAAHDDFDVQAELDRFDADRADWSTARGPAEAGDAEIVGPPLGEFRILWPNGTGSDPMALDDDDLEPTSESEPEPGPAVLDDVSGAVRRALRVMHEASTLPRAAAEPNGGFGELADRGPMPSASATASNGQRRPLVARLNDAAATDGFAPPTPDMRVELVDQSAVIRRTTIAETSPAASTVRAANASPSEPDEGAAATATATDTDTDAATTDAAADVDDLRRGALRRLIDSMREFD